MTYQSTLTYNEPLLRQAVFSFCCRSMGVSFAAASVILVLSFAILLWQGESSWFVGVLGTVLFFGGAFAVAIYIVHFQNSMKKFREMGNPQATFLAEELSFTLTSNLGSSTQGWSSVSEVWRFSGYWLLLFSKAQFVTLPLSSISAEMQIFILRRVRESGGKVDG